MPINARVKLATETAYKCEVCGKTYVRKPLFKKHIQTKHAKIVRTPVETIQMSKQTQILVPATEVVLNNSGINVDEVTLEETTAFVTQESQEFDNRS